MTDIDTTYIYGPAADLQKSTYTLLEHEVARGDMGGQL